MSLRILLIGILGVAAICAVVSAAELMVLQSGFLQIPPAALVMLALLVGFRRLTRTRLSSAEIAILYCMFLLAALVASRGLMEKLIPALVAPRYFANAGNHWAENFFPFLPKWSVAFDPSGPSDQLASRAYYEGLRAGERIPWGVWLRPLSAWAILIGLLFGAFLCLAALLRRPWADQERLAFPLARVALEMIPESGSEPLWGRPLMWIGFAAPALVYSLNSLQAWLPSLPTIPLNAPGLTSWFSSSPWNAVSGAPFYFSFAAAGLLYFVPLDLIFSLWFFFLLTRFQEGVLAGFGMEMTDMPMFPCRLFVGYQVVGAYLVLAFGLLRSAWPYWKSALAGALRSEEASREVLPPRFAMAGLALCLIGMAVWSSALGLSFGWALFQWVAYLLVVCLVLARSVSEGGLLMTEGSFRPVDLYAMAGPPHGLGRGNLAGMAMLDAVGYRDQRGMLLSGLLDALKIGGAEGVKPRAFLGYLCIALVTATLFSAAVQIWLPYRFGALRFYPYLEQGNPIWGFGYYAPHLAANAPYNWQAPVFFGIGAAVAAALIALRSAFVGWPLLPLGYALCGSWTMILLWFPCFLMWIVKGGVLRYGGHKTFHRLRPLFLGFILGEFAMVVVWTLASALAGIPAPQFPWP
jgi:hypothetical protein